MITSIVELRKQSGKVLSLLLGWLRPYFDKYLGTFSQDTILYIVFSAAINAK